MSVSRSISQADQSHYVPNTFVFYNLYQQTHSLYHQMIEIDS